MGFDPVHALEERLAEYERKIAALGARSALLRRVEQTRPSHALDDYLGTYKHPGYGRIEIHRGDRELTLRRGRLTLPLRHWHYDVWAFADNDLFAIHEPHPFDGAGRVRFETDTHGHIEACVMPFEPAVQAVRFARERPVDGR
jgi:hypothetical protein